MTVGYDNVSTKHRNSNASTSDKPLDVSFELDNLEQLTNDQIKELEFNLGNIRRVLIQFEKMNLLKGVDTYDTDLCVTIGNTGCGKSTMLNSLCFGPESLKETFLKNEKSKRRGKKVIEHVSKDDNLKFEIGHKMESKTFIPEFMDYPIEQVLFADVAGMNDTNGSLIEFVNSFLLKRLFVRAK